MNAFLAVVAFILILTAVRYWVGKRWRDGRISTRQAAFVAALAWAAFPLVGYLGGAPWTLPFVAAASLLFFVGVFVVGDWMLSRFAKRLG